MLSLLSTIERVAKRLLELFKREEVACFLSDASRNSTVAFSGSTICWTRISCSLILTHEVNRSIPEESKSSKTDKISFENGTQFVSNRGHYLEASVSQGSEVECFEVLGVTGMYSL